jgi:hypothetical protein
MLSIVDQVKRAEAQRYEDLEFVMLCELCLLLLKRLDEQERTWKYAVANIFKQPVTKAGQRWLKAWDRNRKGKDNE